MDNGNQTDGNNIIPEPKEQNVAKNKKTKLIVLGVVGALLLIVCVVLITVFVLKQFNNNEHQSDDTDDSGLSRKLLDIVEKRCVTGPYEIVYNDSKTEGIFLCKDESYEQGKLKTEERGDLFYASYLGEENNGITKVSLVNLATINLIDNYMITSSFDDTGESAFVTIIDAKDETLTYEKAKLFMKETANNNYNRFYLLYADGYSTPTYKDYLNVLLSLDNYFEDDYYTCEANLSFDSDDAQYRCHKTDGAFFRRYVKNKDNYSSLSTEALFKNRHLGLVLPDFDDEKSDTEKDIETYINENLSSAWRNPFVQGELEFGYAEHVTE